MGRHTVINPKSGRRVYKTGRIGKTITKGASKNKKKNGGKCTGGKCKSKLNDTTKNKVKKSGPIKGKFYGRKGSTKNASPIYKIAGKTKNYADRPSARAFFDNDGPREVFYAGKFHRMAFRSNGSPYWKEI
jgi:hypothetical protein